MRLIHFDLETTGLDPQKDRVIELAYAINGGVSTVLRVNPGVPIPPEATAVHQITDQDVQHAPPFAEIAAHVQGVFTAPGTILVGYNSRQFDTPFLDAELRRAGHAGLPDHTPEIDLFQVWKHLEPRTLKGALKRWTHRDDYAWHTAEGDILAVRDLIRAMPISPTEGVLITSRVSPTPLVELKDGVAYFTFGKHQGEALRDHPDYLEWMLRQQFPDRVLSYAREALKEAGR